MNIHNKPISFEIFYQDVSGSWRPTQRVYNGNWQMMKRVLEDVSRNHRGYKTKAVDIESGSLLDIRG